jgi:2-methylisocitrate lyase-like PEP mutase family enzyme
LTLDDLSKLGVKRISVGSTLSRVAYGAFLRAAEEMRDKGAFSFGDGAVGFRDISVMLAAFR